MGQFLWVHSYDLIDAKNMEWYKLKNQNLRNQENTAKNGLESIWLTKLYTYLLIKFVYLSMLLGTQYYVHAYTESVSMKWPY